MVQLGAVRTGQIALGVAVIALVGSVVWIGSGRAAALSLEHTIGPHCVRTVNTPSQGETTLTDSTLPTLTGVSWAQEGVIVASKTSVGVTVTLSDDCSGAGDVVLELRSSTTEKTWNVVAKYASSTTSSTINDTWHADVPLEAKDAGTVRIEHVLVLTGFASLVYDSSHPPATVNDVIKRLPNNDEISTSSYDALVPPSAATLTVTAS